MIKSKGWVTNTEIDTIRRKKGRNKVDEGPVQESQNIADTDDENVDINHQIVRLKKPLQ